MKNVLHPKRKEVFSGWLHQYLGRTGKKYIWPQVCYATKTAAPIHLIFEKNAFNAPFIKWPLSHFSDIPATHIDFTVTPPVLSSGEPWNFMAWHRIALNGPLRHTRCPDIPTSFWHWREQTVPQGNLTCDIDGVFKDQYGGYIGIEATQIYHVLESADIERDVFEHFKRLFILRYGRTGGFNLWQLKAQKTLMDHLGGRLFMLFHLILNGNGGIRSIGEERVLLLEIDVDTLQMIETMMKTRALPVPLRERITYHHIQSIFDRLF